jgi:hypothetical protein
MPLHNRRQNALMENTKSNLQSALKPRPTHYGYRRTAVPDWRHLIPGDKLILEPAKINEGTISGTVDAVSENGAFLWVVQDDCGERRLFCRTDGYKTMMNPRVTSTC